MKHLSPLALILLTGCSSQVKLTSSATPPASLTKPEKTKTVELSITSSKADNRFSGSSSFDVGPDRKPNVTIDWNGYGFVCKDSSGHTFWRYSNDQAFGKNHSAAFVLKKKVTETEGGSSLSTTTTETVTVKRGVPAKF